MAPEPSMDVITNQVASHEYFKHNSSLIDNILTNSEKFNGIPLGGTNTSININPYSCLGNLYTEPVQEPVQELLQEPVQESLQVPVQESFTVEKLDNNTLDISSIICIIILILLIAVVVLGVFCGFKINM